MESKNIDNLLEESSKMHGHLCPGQVLGVKMSLLGLKMIGINDPKGEDRKKIMVFVEIDRCATDAIQSVTGCSLGRRTLKFMDYGKMAATFINLQTNKAFRIIAKEEARGWAKERMNHIDDKYKAQLEAYKVMDEKELFDIQQVEVKIRQEDMPGRPLRRVRCQRCHEYVQDMREINEEEQILCYPCSKGGYYKKLPFQTVKI
ncbi:MAG TPA: formylmethanofuran dehydrogenase [Nitrospirae bacterium]|nr:formylmethanofuran dehydrogenase [Nitrospirota bacterium]